MIDKKSGNVVEDSAHEDCVDMIDEVISHAEESGYPEHIIESLKGIEGALAEYEPSDEEQKDEEGNPMKNEEDMSDEELENEMHKEISGKPFLTIKIKHKD